MEKPTKKFDPRQIEGAVFVPATEPPQVHGAIELLAAGVRKGQSVLLPKKYAANLMAFISRVSPPPNGTGKTPGTDVRSASATANGV